MLHFSDQNVRLLCLHILWLLMHLRLWRSCHPWVKTTSQLFAYPKPSIMFEFIFFSELCIWYKTCCVCFAITFNIFGLEFGLITLVKDFYGLSTSGLQGELDLAPYTHPVKWKAIKCKTTCSWLKRISLRFVCVICQHIFHNNLSPSFTGIEILCGDGDVYRWVVWRHCHAEGKIKSWLLTASKMIHELETGSTLWLR